ncbi:MAG TPA: hydroxysqualene dehydroxylase HpnE [Opitutaceae bacterium]|jgi:zeta-carotene desaturase
MDGAKAQGKWPAVAVVGGGVAGLSAACALAESGLSVELIERRSHLGGRATSFFHPGVGEMIDNCQHVLFGCCTNLLGFYRRIGVEGRIVWSDRMTMIEPGGRRSVLGPSWLPAPFHAAPRFLAAHAFTLADKVALGRAFLALMHPVPADSTETLGAWLARHGQTRGALDRFWRLVIASALNADVDAIGIPYAAKVIRELFMNSAEAGRMGLSTLPLGELCAPAADFIRRKGGAVVLNTAVESAAWDPESSRWTLATPGGARLADHLVLALPFEGLGRLLPHLPKAEGLPALAEQIGHQAHWPICSVHLWFDRPITGLDHAILLDRELHWLFNKGRLQPWRKVAGSYLELVVSASRSFAALSADQAVQKALAELGEFFPSVRGARLQKSARIKEIHATFGVPPGIDAWRPTPDSPWPACTLAGDWTSTGWPSTMESSARSGHRAAERVLRELGQPKTVLEPDLKPKGLMPLAANVFPAIRK